MTPKLRIACGPATPPHIGSGRLALAHYLFVRRHGGRLTLRLDDIEQQAGPRQPDTVPGDLEWLGIKWDELIRQSARLPLYEAAAERLKQAGRLYPCFENDEELRVKREQRLKRGLSAVYDRAMLKLTPVQRAAAEAKRKRPHWRFLLSDNPVKWRDLVLGAQQVDLATLSDPVLIRADGTPMRSFTSAVDDIEGGITHLIRTDDQCNSTAVQLDIWRALGAETAEPDLCHLPVIQEAVDGRRHRGGIERTLRALRRDGIEAVALAACLAGSDIAAPARVDDLGPGFDLAHYANTSQHFSLTQLLSMNCRVQSTLPFEAVADRLPSGATQSFWHAVRGRLDLLSEARGWWDVVAGTIVPPVIDGEHELLRTALDLLPAEPWHSRVWTEWTDALHAVTGRSGPSLSLPLRLALTGEESGPELRDLLPLMGRTRAANRLQTAL